MQSRHGVRAIEVKAVFFCACHQRRTDRALDTAAIHNDRAFFKLRRILLHKVERILRIERDDQQITLL